MTQSPDVHGNKADKRISVFCPDIPARAGNFFFIQISAFNRQRLFQAAELFRVVIDYFLFLMYNNTISVIIQIQQTKKNICSLRRTPEKR